MGGDDDFDEPAAFDDPDDMIPICGFYREIGLHDHQSPARLKVVKRDIDRAYLVTDVTALYDFAADVMRAPEARIFSAAKLQALFETAAEKRWERPRFDRERLKVLVNGLDSRSWRSPTHYGTDLDAREGVPREEPLGPADERPR